DADVAGQPYASFGIPASVLANYLRENGVVPEKCDLNSILFLLTPSENLAKLQHLVAHIAQFERHIENDTPMRLVLPTIYRNNESMYEGMSIRQLCQRMHDFYRSHDIKRLQKEMFRKAHFPKKVMAPWEANGHLVRNNVELVAIADA